MCNIWLYFRWVSGDVIPIRDGQTLIVQTHPQGRKPEARLWVPRKLGLNHLILCKTPLVKVALAASQRNHIVLA